MNERTVPRKNGDFNEKSFKFVFNFSLKISQILPHDKWPIKNNKRYFVCFSRRVYTCNLHVECRTTVRLTFLQN